MSNKEPCLRPLARTSGMGASSKLEYIILVVAMVREYKKVLISLKTFSSRKDAFFSIYLPLIGFKFLAHLIVSCDVLVILMVIMLYYSRNGQCPDGLR